MSENVTRMMTVAATLGALSSKTTISSIRVPRKPRTNDGRLGPSHPRLHDLKACNSDLNESDDALSARRMGLRYEVWQKKSGVGATDPSNRAGKGLR